MKEWLKQQNVPQVKSYWADDEKSAGKQLVKRCSTYRTDCTYVLSTKKMLYSNWVFIISIDKKG